MSKIHAWVLLAVSLVLIAIGAVEVIASQYHRPTQTGMYRTFPNTMFLLDLTLGIVALIISIYNSNKK